MALVSGVNLILVRLRLGFFILVGFYFKLESLVGSINRLCFLVQSGENLPVLLVSPSLKVWPFLKTFSPFSFIDKQYKI